MVRASYNTDRNKIEMVESLEFRILAQFHLRFERTHHRTHPRNHPRRCRLPLNDD